MWRPSCTEPRRMRVHHINAISTCPLGGRLMDDRGESIVRRGQLVCHCLLVEARDGLVLVDTGLGLQDVAHPHDRLSELFLFLLRPEFREEMTAVRQIQRLGFDARDVRHVVLTHLDFDHAGGLDDFPEATVHVLEPEVRAAVAQATWLDRMRYRPRQWSTHAHWRAHASTHGETWFGLECVRDLGILGAEIVMVPLVGHTLGHAGVAVREDAGWLLLAGDAYFFHGEMDLEHPWCTPGLRFYQWMMEKDRDARLTNQARLRQLAHEHRREVTVTCSHDLHELEQLTGRSAAVPAHMFVGGPHDDAGLPHPA